MAKATDSQKAKEDKKEPTGPELTERSQEQFDMRNQWDEDEIVWLGVDPNAPF